MCRLSTPEGLFLFLDLYKMLYYMAYIQNSPKVWDYIGKCLVFSNLKLEIIEGLDFWELK